MVRPNKKKLEKMKANDKVIKQLNAIKQEDKKLKKGEFKLAHWLTKKLIRKEKIKNFAKDASKASKEAKKSSKK